MLARWMVIGAVWAVASLAVAPPALAQPVFFDDFDGPDLLPHWQTPNPSHWEYSLSDSQLHVTGLFYPGVPHLGGNFAAIGSLFEPQTDLRVEAWMGWEPGDAPHMIALQVRGFPTGTGHLADFRYELAEGPGATPMLWALSGGVEAVAKPAPPPGIHHFSITRTGAQYDFHLNGELFATLADPIGIPATGVVFDFLGPSEAPLGPFHIDRVRVVPAPGSLGVCAVAAAGYSRRRRPAAGPGPTATRLGIGSRESRFRRPARLGTDHLDRRSQPAALVIFYEDHHAACS